MPSVLQLTFPYYRSTAYSYNDLAARPEIITAQNPGRDQNSYRRGQIHHILERKLCFSLKEKELLFKEMVPNCKKKIREF